MTHRTNWRNRYRTACSAARKWAFRWRTADMYRAWLERELAAVKRDRALLRRWVERGDEL